MWRLSLGAGLHFTALDALKGAAEARRPDRRMTATDAFLVGGLSRAIAATALCPVTLVRHRIFESDDFDCDLARLHCGAWQAACIWVAHSGPSRCEDSKVDVASLTCSVVFEQVKTRMEYGGPGSTAYQVCHIRLPLALT